MPRVGLVWRNGRVVTTNTDTWEMIDSGGEADIYRARIKGRNYIVKVFTEKQTRIARPHERLMEIARRLLSVASNCMNPPPRSLVARGFPVATGMLSGRAVLVFPEVEEFRTLASIVNRRESVKKYLLQTPAGTRRRMAMDVMHALACLETADIIHVDLTTSNIAFGVLDGEYGVFLFDVETSAVMGTEYGISVIPGRDSHFINSDSLRKIGIPIRPPRPEELPISLEPTRTDPEILSWALWTMVWYGLQVVGYIYTGMSIFQGLRNISIRSWEKIVRHERERGYVVSWPPKAFMELGLLDRREYMHLSKFWVSLPVLKKVMYQTYVVDVAERKHLPTYTLSMLWNPSDIGGDIF